MGIGKKLMNELTTLGGAFSMEKIMLTVFKGLYPLSLDVLQVVVELKWNFIANTSAVQFYKHIGCVVPSRLLVLILDLFIHIS